MVMNYASRDIATQHKLTASGRLYVHAIILIKCLLRIPRSSKESPTWRARSVPCRSANDSDSPDSHDQRPLPPSSLPLSHRPSSLVLHQANLRSVLLAFMTDHNVYTYTYTYTYIKQAHNDAAAPHTAVLTSPSPRASHLRP